MKKPPPRRYGDTGAQLSFGIGASMQWPSDDGYRVAGIGDRQGHVDLFANYDVAKLSENWVLSAGAAFRTLGGADEEGVELSVNTLQADLTLRYRGLDWFAPHLRAAAGASFIDVEIDDSALAVSYEGSDAVFAGNLGAGFTLRTKRRFFETRRGRLASLSFGVLFEGGMVFAPAAEPDLEPSSSVGEGIEQRQAELGKLDLSAPYLRIAALTRF